MNLVFFDFYPVVRPSSTLGDVLHQAAFYFMFEVGNLLILLLFFVLAFTSFFREFSRKHMVLSVPLSLAMMLVLSLVEKSIFTMRLSNILLGVAYNFVTIVISYFMLFFILYFRRNSHTELDKISSLRALPVKTQVVFLALFFVSCFTFRHVVYAPLMVILFAIAAGMRSKSKKLKPKALQFKLTDGVPLLLMCFVGFVLSFVKVGTVVCNFPLIKECFNCPN